MISQLIKIYGSPQVDLFASPTNHRLQEFLTKTVERNAGGPDALKEDWK